MELENIEIHSFINVESAISHITTPPDIIILDHFLPKEKGIDSIPKFKEKAPESEIVIVSSQQDLELFKKSYELGVNEYFKKGQLTPHLIKKYIEDFIIRN